MRNLVCVVAIGVSVCMSIRPAYGQTDLKRLSLEELMDVDVTSVGRTRLPLERTAAAVTVITAEEIRRSGITNIPELLRVIPGVQVARMNAGSWAISARGFNSTAANKLLVQIDGRPVYSPLFSGTFWEIQDLVLDEIARIEVVRGPGASLYGPNAVNGIINIITKSAHLTKQPYVTVNGGGSEDLAVVSGRVGGGTGDTSYRVDAKYFYRDQLRLANGLDALDTARTGRMGYRVDSTHGASDFTLQGDFYNGSIGIGSNREDGKLLGGNILGRAIHRFAGGSELQVQTYFQRDYRRVPLQSEFSQEIFDVEFQHNFQVSRHGVTWGGQFRSNHDDTRVTPVLSFSPVSRTYPSVSGFVVDEIPLARERVLVSVGSKFEHNDFSGGEIQPSVRASWLLKTDHSAWAAVSRAVRTPTRFDSDIRFGPPGLTIFGNPDFHAEELVAYEMGYRGRPHPQLTLDVAVFYNVYDQLRSLEPLTPGVIIERNSLNAESRGFEIESMFDVTPDVRLRGYYSFLGKSLSFDPGVVGLLASLEGNDPRHQFRVETAIDLPRNFEFDSAVRFVDQLPDPVVPGYAELDARLGWNPTRGIETALIGRNLLRPRHPEFGAPAPNRIEAERNVYARITLRF